MTRRNGKDDATSFASYSPVQPNSSALLSSSVNKVAHVISSQVNYVSQLRVFTINQRKAKVSPLCNGVGLVSTPYILFNIDYGVISSLEVEKLKAEKKG
jgi:hypothetical protein